MNRRSAAYLIGAFCAALTVLAGGANAQDPCPCRLPDNGFGTVAVHPNCPEGYNGPMVISQGIPGGTIEIDARLHNFLNQGDIPGGALGGTTGSYDALLRLQMTGTGTLNGFSRSIEYWVLVWSLWGPRTNNDPVQTFPHQIESLVLNVVGDPDFDQLQVLIGSDYGLANSGSTTLTRIGLPGTDFLVDSFFDISYRITFVGAPGSVLDGMSGATDASTTLAACDSGPLPVENASWGSIKSLYR